MALASPGEAIIIPALPPHPFTNSSELAGIFRHVTAVSCHVMISLSCDCCVVSCNEYPVM